VACRDQCRFYKPTIKRTIHQNPIRPELDIRWCDVCYCLVQWSGGIVRKSRKIGKVKVMIKFLTNLWCPCCGFKLRSSARHKQWQRRKERKLEKEIKQYRLQKVDQHFIKLPQGVFS